MSDVNVKLVSQEEKKEKEQGSSSYLLNVQVLNDLKSAIQKAKETNALAAKADQR